MMDVPIQSISTSPHRHGEGSDQKTADEQDEELSSCFDQEMDLHQQQSESSQSSTMFDEPGNETNDFGSNIARKESKAVRVSKICLYLVLTVCALVTAGITWVFVRREEEDDFEQQFVVYGNQIVGVVHDNSKIIFKQLQTLSTAITSHALDNPDANFPNLTVPHFYRLSQELGDLTMYAPLVQVENKTAYEAYVANEQALIFADTFGQAGASFAAPNPLIHPIDPKTYQDLELSLDSNDNNMFPVIQYGPHALSSSLINLDLTSHPVLQQTLQDVLKVSHTMLSEYVDVTFLMGHTEATTDVVTYTPRSVMAEPVFDKFEEPHSVVGVLVAVEPWYKFFQSQNLPDAVHGFLVYVHSSCASETQDLTFQIDGQEVVFRGYEDQRDSKYDHLGLQFEFAEFARYDGTIDGARHCNYSMTIYPSQEFEDDYYTAEPYLFATILVVVFAVTVAAFAIYDWTVSRRQRAVMQTALNTTDIVQSLFPKSVGQRLIAEAELKGAAHSTRKKLDAFLQEDDPEKPLYDSDPIAEYFTDTTIIFADIVGFTAWSSIREPKSVFHLLEAIYNEFDKQALRRGVFKVETIGDCYVAVTGLPNPRPDHCVAMARFARDCVYSFGVITHRLEEKLGPDTTDLAIRIGVHSGPVTAGVLRGDRARFQLFGDTMNTASRMESTGKPNKIQISQEMADLLTDRKKGHWISKREDLIVAKGKGRVQTYWLDLKTDEHGRSTTDASISSGSPEVPAFSDEEAQESNHLTMKERTKQADVLAKKRNLAYREQRLVQWNTETLGKLLREVIAQRSASGVSVDSVKEMGLVEQEFLQRQTIPIDEFKTTLDFFAASTTSNTANSADPEPLPAIIRTELQNFMQSLVFLHRGNQFHCFEHGSQCMMALMKLFARVTPAAKGRAGDTAYTHMFDPLVKFTVALAMLIRNVDHSGCSNEQVVTEKPGVAALYRGRLLAEQNALDLSWSLLMSTEYPNLRRAIYGTNVEFKRFRRFLVNSVLATEFTDKQLQAQRATRWYHAFPPASSFTHDQLSMGTDAGNGTGTKGDAGRSSSGDNNTNTNTTRQNLRGTVVLEALIRVAVSSHFIQHFQIFQKWNARLFAEEYKAYQAGRSGGDAVSPFQYWYDREIGRFDEVAIPLTRQLKECKVLGEVATEEYADCTLRNRREWVTRGRQIVQELQESMRQEEEANANAKQVEELPEQHPEQAAQAASGS